MVPIFLGHLCGIFHNKMKCHARHHGTELFWAIYVGFSIIKWNNLCRTQSFLHTNAFTADAFTHTLSHKRFYTQTLLHTDAFTHRHFYTQTLLHTDAFTHRRFYTQTLLHTDAFTHRRFYTTEAFTHRCFYTQKLLHTPHRSFVHTEEIAILPQFLCERVAPDNLNSQFYLSFWRSALISCERVATGARKSQFYLSFWRSNIVSCDRVAFRAVSLAMPRALREK